MSLIPGISNAMNIRKYIICCTILFLSVSISHAQFITFFSAFRSNEARADDYFDKNQFNKALELYQLSFKKDPTNQFLRLKIAKTFFMLNKTKEAERMYSALVKNPKVLRPDDRLEYIRCLFSNGKYEMGKVVLSQFIKDNPKNVDAKSLKERILNVNEFYKDSALYSIKKLDFNDKASDFSPIFYEDGITYISSRKEPLIDLHVSNLDSTKFFDLYKIKVNHDSLMGKPQEFDKSLNSYYHQGPATFFDNFTKMVFTSNRKDGLSDSKNLHLYFAEKDTVSGKWKNVTLLPFNNNTFSSGHPTMNHNGDLMIFSSDVPGGVGGIDLYQVTYLDGKWGVPSNLGKSINTPNDEVFPFLLNDSTLYFSTEGYPGLGKLDIFKATGKMGKFTSVTNVGAPINTPNDDFGLVYDKTETYGYFSSNRNFQNDDIYYFGTNYLVLKLKIVDDLSRKPLEKYSYTLQDEINEEETKGFTDRNNVLFKLIPGRKYTLTIKHPAYKPYIRPIWIVDKKEKEMELTAEMGRKIKNFIHATITRDEDDQLESQTSVVLINLDSLRSDTLKRFFDKSEFDFEVDNSMHYVLVSQKDNRIAVEEIKPTKNKKASSVVYTPLRLKKFYPFEIKGIAKEAESNTPLSGYLVSIRDVKLGNTYQVWTNDVGEFSFTGSTYTKYELAIENTENRTVLNDIDYVKAHGQIFELILK